MGRISSAHFQKKTPRHCILQLYCLPAPNHVWNTAEIDQPFSTVQRRMFLTTYPKCILCHMFFSTANLTLDDAVRTAYIRCPVSVRKASINHTIPVHPQSGVVGFDVHFHQRCNKLCQIALTSPLSHDTAVPIA